MQSAVSALKIRHHRYCFHSSEKTKQNKLEPIWIISMVSCLFSSSWPHYLSVDVPFIQAGGTSYWWFLQGRTGVPQGMMERLPHCELWTVQQHAQHTLRTVHGDAVGSTVACACSHMMVLSLILSRKTSTLMGPLGSVGSSYNTRAHFRCAVYQNITQTNIQLFTSVASLPMKSWFDLQHNLHGSLQKQLLHQGEGVTLPLPTNLRAQWRRVKQRCQHDIQHLRISNSSKDAFHREWFYLLFRRRSRRRKKPDSNFKIGQLKYVIKHWSHACGIWC